ncbi:MAG: hypothetical protein EHM42_04180 [Planctomycetaceae bacterium]|nr:MAG: hypothetical protein EHM42_04180 [Planctomycetaceae bacterium]
MSTPPDNTLPELHRLHLLIQEAQEKIDHGPRVLKARRQATANKETNLEAQRQKHKQLRMLADQKSLQLKSNEVKIGDLKGKLNQAASNREFDIIRGQIEADKVANSVLEDEILDALEKVDVAQLAIRELEDQIAAARTEEAKFAAEVEQALPGHEQRLHELQAELAQTESRLPPELMATYRRLVQAHGAAALAEVENETCTACYVRLTTQAAVSILTGQLMFCRSCGRLLYSRREAADA